MGKILSHKHNFAHDCVRFRISETLKKLGCTKDSVVLDIGVGYGLECKYIIDVSENIIGIDLSSDSLKKFANDYKCSAIKSDARKLPINSNLFDFVIISGVLHHLVDYNEIRDALKESVRVLKDGGGIIISEPNLLHPSGILMNIINSLRPGITGFDPNERALSPMYILKSLDNLNLRNIKIEASSFVHNRYPLFLSKIIFKFEEKILFRNPFKFMGWWTTLYGQKHEETH